MRPAARPDSASDEVPVYVVRRKWHVDIGFAATDIDPTLAPIKSQFAGANYLLFGFGDRAYLLSKNKRSPTLLRALWPGPGLILVTSIEGSPASAFGSSQVIELRISGAESRAIQGFIRASIGQSELTPYAPGPYEGSEFLAARPPYSALHTCNTWSAEALRAGGEPVHVKGVILANQLWSQARALAICAINCRGAGIRSDKRP